MKPKSLTVPEPQNPRPTRAPSVVLSNIWPSIEGGRYPVKRVAGEPLEIWADIFRDGHGKLDAVLKWRRRGISAWEEIHLTHSGNDRWGASFTLMELGEWEYTIEAWQDNFKTWLNEFERKFEAREKDDRLQTETIEGSIILEDSAKIAEQAGNPQDATVLRKISRAIYDADPADVMKEVDDTGLHALMTKWTNRSCSTTALPIHRVLVERERARFSAWYEFFPRSAEGSGTRHSTFRDCLERIRYARDLGFNVIYFPPIHPVGVSHRKGKDNALTCEPDDVGSPWAIGSDEGGHYTVHPELGTLEDFEWLTEQAAEIGMEIALDFAINCSPDHPYVKEHPDWFFQRPDGTIKYAENPPKKYQDIYPLNFHCDDWCALWQEMVNIALFWVERNVKIFRVDNPHTKPVAFWEYLISEVRAQHPDVIFLAEAFTRPRMMEMLGKIGFTQSYTYFTWRVHKQEIMEYVNELTQTEVSQYFRGNFWPNTPDILAEPLVDAPPATFKIRATLAATLLPSWGIYSGFEFCENEQHPDREEYRNNEKYQLVERDWNKPGNIKSFIARLNGIRNSNPVFEETSNIRFLDADNDQMLAYVKHSPSRENAVIVIINLDPSHIQEATVTVPLEDLGLDDTSGSSYKVHDLMYDDTYTWKGSRNYVSLNPRSKPVHILKVESPGQR